MCPILCNREVRRQHKRPPATVRWLPRLDMSPPPAEPATSAAHRHDDEEQLCDPHVGTFIYPDADLYYPPLPRSPSAGPIYDNPRAISPPASLWLPPSSPPLSLPRGYGYEDYSLNDSRAFASLPPLSSWIPPYSPPSSPLPEDRILEWPCYFISSPSSPAPPAMARFRFATLPPTPPPILLSLPPACAASNGAFLPPLSPWLPPYSPPPSLHDVRILDNPRASLPPLSHFPPYSPSSTPAMTSFQFAALSPTPPSLLLPSPLVYAASVQTKRRRSNSDLSRPATRRRGPSVCPSDGFQPTTPPIPSPTSPSLPADSAAFACPVCDWVQTNNRPSDLARHALTHKAPQLACTRGCGQTFRRSDGLKRHLDNPKTKCARKAGRGYIIPASLEHFLYDE
ncbi:hypothetical protein FA95DRAFT_652829 [Auriscalpium vulgare]|uniref:Uncharacterized protein n=1 Tax=Auriscalpium vulgare TaxID=40419 RepID=A0ACB8RD34_9AGAM|nr:hypothetical protein FA95DRAFT_652829 [Auriscalpium vulgare]